MKKHRTHHMEKLQNDVSNFFICDFVRNDFYKAHIKLYKSQKALRRKDYLQASSIATATATVMLSLWGVTGCSNIHTRP